MSAGFTHVVTFTRTDKNGTSTTDPIPAKIEDITDRIGRTSAERTWEACISADARYPDGRRVSAGHLINAGFLPSGSAAIGKPRPVFGALPDICVRFQESD